MKVNVKDELLKHSLKRAPLSEPQIEINAKTKELTLQYEPRTSMAVCSISDIHGSVHCQGKLEEKDSITHCVKELPEGVYILCIVDGEDMIKQQFRIE